MSTRTLVRGLRSVDTPLLFAALSATVANAYPGGGVWLRTHLDPAPHPGRDISVALTRGGRPVGLLIAKLKPRGVKLSCFWVTPHLRRQGVGRALLDRAVTAFGARPMYLTVDSTVAGEMAPLLTAAGFTQATALPGRYRPGAVELVYTRTPDPLPNTGADAGPDNGLAAEGRPESVTPVRALSLTRPWGQLILAGGKNIENRSRRTGHRGLLVLHGAQSTTDLAQTFCADHGLPAPPAVADCATGYLGVAHLVGVDCHADDCANSCSPWAMGASWHWRVAFPAAFPAPIPGRGNVSVWTPPAEVLDAVAAAIAPAAPTR